MSRLDELRRVADLIGIHTRHVDALGVQHEPSEETLAALIAAFGLPSDPKDAADRLAEEEMAAPFGLAPVQIVAQETSDPMLLLRLPSGTDAVEWHCRFEDGTEASGRSDGAALRLPTPLPLGYHRLALDRGEAAAEVELIVAPSSCHLPQALQPGRRSWGLTAQLYGLRSGKSGTEGDCDRDITTTEASRRLMFLVIFLGAVFLNVVFLNVVLFGAVLFAAVSVADAASTLLLASVVGGLICVLFLNLYYRGFIYIVCGGRKNVVAAGETTGQRTQ